MGLFSDVIASAKRKTPEIYARLHKDNPALKNDAVSVIGATFSESKKDPRFASWVADLISSDLRANNPGAVKKASIFNKIKSVVSGIRTATSSADDDVPVMANTGDPLKDSILFILSGGYTSADYTEAVRKAAYSYSTRDLVLMGIIIFIVLIFMLKIVKVKWAHLI